MVEMSQTIPRQSKEGMIVQDFSGTKSRGRL